MQAMHKHYIEAGQSRTRITRLMKSFADLANKGPLRTRIDPIVNGHMKKNENFQIRFRVAMCSERACHSSKRDREGNLLLLYSPHMQERRFGAYLKTIIFPKS